MGVIFALSTDTFSSSRTESILESVLSALGVSLEPVVLSWLHFGVRKLAHMVAYAILASLLYRAFRAESEVKWQLKWAVLAFTIASVYALLDEYHQAHTAQRSASLADSLLDMAGSLGMLVGKRFSCRSRPSQGREI